LRSTWFRLINFLTVDSGGWRAVFGALLRALLVGAAAAFARAFVHETDGKFKFDLTLFVIIVGAFAVTNVISHFFDVFVRGGSVLKPINGRVFRSKRKTQTAAVLARIAFLTRRGHTTTKELEQLVTDILDCIALHVRDARGSHDEDRIDVFVSLLVEDGNDFVVVARDSGLHSIKHRRPVPVRHPKGMMIASRATEAKRAVSVGDLCHEYPEGPQNKPYRSILAIPMINDDEVVSVVSIDSTRPYFFQSFKTGDVENELENGLLPYIQTLRLALEQLGHPVPMWGLASGSGTH
jgi:hypothetical protein